MSRASRQDMPRLYLASDVAGHQLHPMSRYPVTERDWIACIFEEAPALMWVQFESPAPYHLVFTIKSRYRVEQAASQMAMAALMDFGEAYRQAGTFIEWRWAA